MRGGSDERFWDKTVAVTPCLVATDVVVLQRRQNGRDVPTEDHYGTKLWLEESRCLLCNEASVVAVFSTVYTEQ